MGYDLRITRVQVLAENEGNEISIDEWLKLVRDDPELTLAPQYGPYFAVWSGNSTLYQPWFDWQDGNIVTKSPEESVIRKMLVLAQQLRATVRGEENERYSLSKRGLVIQRVGKKAELIAPGPTSW